MERAEKLKRYKQRRKAKNTPWQYGFRTREQFEFDRSRGKEIKPINRQGLQKSLTDQEK